jgi:general secretion pathway protein A
MYLKFYNLKKEPFHITPDPEFLYLSPSHKQALATIIFGIEQRKGFVTIIGAPGVGKTTIVRTYLESIDKEQVKVIYIFNARLTFEDILKEIHVKLGKEVSTTNIFDMINSVNEALIEEYKKGNTIVLILDEVQNVPITTLESLRMLSNLETSKEKLLQMVLVGQPEFEEGLNLNKMQQMKQRIVVQTTILPLNQKESIEYIKHRLRISGANSSDVLTDGALIKITKKANGIPRTLNILCDNTLITGFAAQQRPANTKIVKEALADLNQQKRQLSRKWYYAASLAALVLLITIFLFFISGTRPSWNFLSTGASKRTVPQDSDVKAAPVSIPNSQNNEPVRPPQAEQSTTDPQAIKGKKVSEAPPVKTKPSRRTVQKGDTLSRIAEEIYGSKNDKIIKLIQENNPQINDPNLIKTGINIKLPPAPPSQQPVNE